MFGGDRVQLERETCERDRIGETCERDRIGM